MLAYLIMVHEKPRQLARLVEALEDPRAAFFIHVDRKTEEAQFRYVTRDTPNVHFVRPRGIVEWGAWSMVQTEFTLIRAALDAGAQHLVLLSGEDFPVWDNDRLVKHFLSDSQSQMEHHQIPTPYWDRGGLNRIEQYWLGDDPIPLQSRVWRKTVGRIWTFVWHRGIRYVGNLFLKLGYELGLRRKVPGGVEFHMGSQWWNLSRACAESALDFAAQRPDVVEFMHHSHVPDESFFQTALMNSVHRDEIGNDSLRYVEWDGGHSPRILELSDLDGILGSGKAFARKLISGRTVLGVTSEPLVQALTAHRSVAAKGGDENEEPG